jgi:hypothetical protein
MNDPRGNTQTSLATELQRFKAAHPEIIITFPSEAKSCWWEVSCPDQSSMAFDSLSGMLRALKAVYEKSPVE